MFRGKSLVHSENTNIIRLRIILTEGDVNNFKLLILYKFFIICGTDSMLGAPAEPGA